MNKYEATLHTFCDACVSAKSCKGSCKRMSTMEHFIKKYEHVCRAFDKACIELSDGDKKITKKRLLDECK